MPKMKKSKRIGQKKKFHGRKPPLEERLLYESFEEAKRPEGTGYDRETVENIFPVVTEAHNSRTHSCVEQNVLSSTMPVQTLHLNSTSNPPQILQPELSAELVTINQSAKFEYTEQPTELSAELVTINQSTKFEYTEQPTELSAELVTINQSTKFEYTEQPTELSAELVTINQSTKFEYTEQPTELSAELVTINQSTKFEYTEQPTELSAELVTINQSTKFEYTEQPTELSAELVTINQSTKFEYTEQPTELSAELVTINQSTKFEYTEQPTELSAELVTINQSTKFEYTEQPTELSAELVTINQSTKFEYTEQPTELSAEQLYVLLSRHVQDSAQYPHDWSMLKINQGILFFKLTSNTINVKVQRSLNISSMGDFHIFINNLPLPREHNVWSKCQDLPALSLETLDIWKEVVQSVLNCLSENICPGNFESTYAFLWLDKWRYEKIGFIESNYDAPSPFQSTFRVRNCSLLTKRSKCNKCLAFKNVLQVQHHREKVRNVTEASQSRSIQRPNSTMNENELKQKLSRIAAQVCSLKSQVRYRDTKIRKLIQIEGVTLESNLSNDFTALIEGNKSNLTDVQKVFWEQQQKSSNLKSKKGMRWHPLLIRLALQIKMISNSAYEALRDSGCISLPSQRTLYDYTHHMTATEGCQKVVFDKLLDNVQKKVRDPEKRFFSLMFDEMNIENNLCYKAATGEFLGFSNLDQVETEFAKVSQILEGKKNVEPDIAKKVLVYMVQGLSCKLREVVAVYSTVDLVASQIHSRTWDVISQLESIGIKVLCLVCDGGSQNRKFYNMHPPLTTPSKHTFDTINLSSPDSRPIFFLSDPPHLLKTLRDCFSNSYGHRRARNLWNNGDISWFLITKLFEDTKNDVLRLASKLTSNHVYLNASSCMKVKYAAQVFSETVASALEEHFKNHPNIEISKTVEFIRLCDQFFDCLNGAHPLQGTKKQNPLSNSYTATDDCRFTYLNDTVLNYFDNWQSSVMSRPGEFTNAEREKMMISRQTVDGVYITVKGFTGAVRYLLEHGVKFVDARCFNQDLLEQYLSKHRHSGGLNDDPDLDQFSQNTATLRLQGDLAVASKKGNTESERCRLLTNSEPLPKKRKD